MQRIAIAVVLSGLLAACGQQAPATGEAGAPAAELDFIEAVPIDEDAPAPIAQPRPAATKEASEEDREPAEDKAAEATAAPAGSPTPVPAAPASDAASATRRANETTATPPVASSTERPYRPN
ncbi:hypothetical protein [Brevundimonas sp.]|uniref:hypothetical protein n=1 Tax=Brevundimonas sp. TaxID=1871086 RepID=UPI003D12AF5F